MNAALREAEFSNTVAGPPRNCSPRWRKLPTRDVSVLAALALARIGDIDRADRMAHDLAERFPLNTAINRYWLPAIYASIEIKRGKPTKALEDLQTTTQYELGTPLPQFEVGGSLYPVYIRGEVYLLLIKGKEAAVEFQKFLDHRGVALNSPLGALARLQLGRAYALQGNTAQSRAAYQDFFGLWRDADPDIPTLIVAKSEYASLSKRMANTRSNTESPFNQRCGCDDSGRVESTKLRMALTQFPNCPSLGRNPEYRTSTHYLPQCGCDVSSAGHEAAALDQSGEARMRAKGIPLDVVGQECEMDVAHLECPVQPIKRFIILTEAEPNERGCIGRNIAFPRDRFQYFEHGVRFLSACVSREDVAT